MTLPDSKVPDLYSIFEVTRWEKARLAEGWSRSDLFEHYQGIGTPIALYRSFFYINLPSGEKHVLSIQIFKDIQKKTNLPHFRLMAEAYLMAAVAFHAFIEGDDFDLQHTCEHLHEILRQVQALNPQGEFERECEYRVLRQLVWRNLLLNHNEEGLRLARQLLACALSLTEDLQHASRHLYLAFLHNLYRYRDVFEEMVPTDPLLVSRTPYVVADNALCFSNLGDFDAAIREIDAHHNHLEPSMALFYREYLQLLHFRGNLDTDFRSFEGKIVSHFNLIYAMQLLFQAMRLPEGKSDLEQRETLLQKCLLALDQDKETLLRYELHFELWIRSCAHFLLKNHHLSRYYLAKIKHDFPQDEYFQLLYHSLILELCAIPGLDSGFQASTSMNAVLSILHNASRRSRSNFLGVEHLLDSLFPLVSCAAYFLGEGLNFSGNKKEFLIDFKRKNHSHGLKLPLNYCLEVFLREVVQDEHLVLAAPLNGEMTRQRDQFHQSTHHTPLTIFRLGYLFLKLELTEIRPLLEDLYFTFGLPEKIRSRYQKDLLEEVLPLVRQLLTSKLQPAAFDRWVQRIRGN